MDIPKASVARFFTRFVLLTPFTRGSFPPRPNGVSLSKEFSEVERLISYDPQLATFWKSAWENDSGIPIEVAIARMRDGALRDLDMILGILDRRPPNAYRELLDVLGCFIQQFRGSGFKTALAAAALALLHREDDNPEVALALAANELESDTDTIGTMAGAIVGCIAEFANRTGRSRTATISSRRPSDWPVFRSADHKIASITRMSRTGTRP